MPRLPIRRVAGHVMRAMIVAALTLAQVLTSGAPPAHATAEASGKPHYSIVVLVSSEPNGTESEELRAIRAFVIRRVAMINAAGGVRGHPLRLTFLDDQQSAARTQENVRRALADERLIGIVGLWNSSRGATVVDAIGASGIPFISEMSVNKLFAAYPNIYTMTRSIDHEASAINAFIKAGYRKVAFVGRDKDAYTSALHRAISDGGTPVAVTRHIAADRTLSADEIKQLASELKSSGVDLICVSLGSDAGARLLGALAREGIQLPAFILLGTVGKVLRNPDGAGYPGAMYDVAEGGVPKLNNERLQQFVRSGTFGRDLAIFSPDALGYGARYADLVAMITTLAGESEANDPRQLRRDIGRALSSFTPGNRIYRGWAQDWSFAEGRASSEQTLIVWRPAGRAFFMLAPLQYVRVGAEVRTVPVVYVGIDMTRVYNIDTSERTFQADFYLSLKSERDIAVSQIEFTTAARSLLDNRALVSIRELDSGKGRSSGGVRLYKVSGKFMFNPALEAYPFDTQKLSISFQPLRTTEPFFVQPPPAAARDKLFEVDGWRLATHYVGSDQDLIVTIRDATGDPRTIPFYKFNYTWVVSRLTTDFMLRAAIPLLFIVLVAYLAVFTPRREFEARIAIQVTALLSAIALYLSIAKPSADAATLSDRLFVGSQIAISLLIGLSILETNRALMGRAIVRMPVRFVQFVLFPVCVLLVTAAVVRLAGGVTLPDWLRPALGYAGITL
ncbi:MAG: ABC transporter substrate-binding protein [Hyphomicrobiaceae bacterium]|nr:ABC transporter substrate-binding protein [Hyphomicrobiaceae bacterium]